MRAAVLALVLHGCASGDPRADGGVEGDGRTPTAHQASLAPGVTAQPPPSAADAAVRLTPTPPAVPWAQKLAPLLFRDRNTLADVQVRLYRDDGSLDEAAANELTRVLWAAKVDEGAAGRSNGAPRPKPQDDETPHVSRRLLQLVVKAAAHFDAHEVEVISSHRGSARKGSRHRTGEAIDFVFSGIAPKALAELLRTYAKVGVGVYVHPRSQFVHLDVREQSYHWIDGSPPGRSWREHPLPDPTAAARDAAHEPAQDLPQSLMQQ
jgi:hypothetical protein